MYQLAQDALVDNACEDLLDLPEEEEHPHQLWTLARKFWLPAFLLCTVLTNLDNPIMLLLIKVTLFLLSTKPNPYSVYIFVDQVRKLFYFLVTSFNNTRIREFNCPVFLNVLVGLSSVPSRSFYWLPLITICLFDNT